MTVRRTVGAGRATERPWGKPATRGMVLPDFPTLDSLCAPQIPVDLAMCVLICHRGRWYRVREFGELEMAIMDVMWDGEGPYVVREVRDRLRYNRPVAYTTVMTVMNILHQKGMLHRDKDGRAWRYWPAESREEHQARLMWEVLRSGGDAELTMRSFLARVSTGEMETLRDAVIDESRRRPGAPSGSGP